MNLGLLRHPLARLPKPSDPQAARFKGLTSQHIIPKEAKLIDIGGGFRIRTMQGGENLKALIEHTQKREGLKITGKTKKRKAAKSDFAKQLLDLI